MPPTANREPKQGHAKRHHPPRNPRGPHLHLTAQARESAQRTACRSNLNQIYLALETYAADHGSDGHSVDLPCTPLLPLKRSILLKPYLEGSSCLYCPDLPAHAKRYLASSYLFRPIGKELYQNSLGLTEADKNRIAAEAREQGGNIPIV